MDVTSLPFQMLSAPLLPIAEPPLTDTVWPQTQVNQLPHMQGVESSLIPITVPPLTTIAQPSLAQSSESPLMSMTQPQLTHNFQPPLAQIAQPSHTQSAESPLMPFTQPPLTNIVTVQLPLTLIAYMQSAKSLLMQNATVPIAPVNASET